MSVTSKDTKPESAYPDPGTPWDGMYMNSRRVDEGVWELKSFTDTAQDHFEIVYAVHIRSVGREKATGRFFAAVDSRFYSSDRENSPFECLWLY